MQTNRQKPRSIILTCMVDRLNLSQTPYLRRLLLPLVIQNNLEIKIDLRHVRFMDCKAVGCIIDINQIAQHNNTTLILYNLRGNVKLLADTLKLSNIIKIEKKEKITTSINHSPIHLNNIHNATCIHSS